MTLLVLDNAVCGRYDEHNCNKCNKTLGFNISNNVNQIILHYVHVMSLFTVKRDRLAEVVKLLNYIGEVAAS
jgi:hypothetical protein